MFEFRYSALKIEKGEGLTPSPHYKLRFFFVKKNINDQ